MSKRPRNIPGWMKGRGKAVGSALNNIVSGQTSNKNQNRGNIFSNLEDAKRRNGKVKNPSENDEINDTEPLDRFSELPMIKYDGKIKYLREFHDVAETFDNLLSEVSKTQDMDVPVSFDLEWSFDYKSGPLPTAVMQVCLDLNQCYVVQMSDLKKIPASLSAFLYHEKTILHGVNIKNDLRKLARDFPCFNGDKLIEKCLDLGDFYNKVFNSGERWSLDRLAAQTIKHRVDKTRQIRMSNWNRSPLSGTQLLYASIDVYVRSLKFI
jgi:hypothetical protein